MVTWKDRLRPASFRGVPFFVEESESEVGRRSVSHEYPGSDTPSADDMGKRARAFSVIGFVIGKDYFPARNALIEACEKEGPGLLIHPFYGEILVILPQPARIKETFRKGGMATFTFRFIESGEEILPSLVTDYQVQALADVSALVAASEEAFEDSFGVETITSLVEDAVAFTGDVKDTMVGAVSTMEGLYQDSGIGYG